MNQSYKITIAIFAAVAVILLIYFGSYLPLRKSQLYIEGYTSLSQVKSLDEFNNLFNRALDFYSPVGQDEVVSGYLGVVINVLNQNPPPNRELTDTLIKQSEERTLPIIESKKGFLLSQNAFKLGLIYRVAAVRFNDAGYLDKAIALLEQGLNFSPNRAVFLYNLFDLYQAKGEKEKAREIGEKVLRYFPEDEKVRQIMKELAQERTK